MDDNIAVFAIVVIALFIVVIVWIHRAIERLINKTTKSKKRQSKVPYDLILSYSTKYQHLIELFSNSPVVLIPETIHVEHSYKSKQSMENANKEEVIILLANNNPEIKELYENLTRNREYKQEFLKNVSLIGETEEAVIASTGLKKSRFQEIESNLIQSLVNNVREDASIEIKLCYRTPKGTYLYTRILHADYQDLSNAYDETGKRQAAKMARDLERSKLTSGLRYDVLRRDGFKCTICGAGPADGVKLHVDHIIPVSKGGKTEMDNLRTLCERCNLGKGNKYDSSGMN